MPVRNTALVFSNMTHNSAVHLNCHLDAPKETQKWMFTTPMTT